MCTSDEWHPILQSSFVPVPLLAAFEVYLRLRLSSKSREKLKNVNHVAFDFLSFVFKSHKCVISFYHLSAHVGN